MAANTCVLPSTPDIVGIGVRCSIYGQTLLCFLPPILVILKKSSMDGLALSERLATTSLPLAFLTLVIAIVQALDNDLSSYHAHIALKLGGLNIVGLMVLFWTYAKYEVMSSESLSCRSGTCLLIISLTRTNAENVLQLFRRAWRCKCGR